MWKFEKLTGVYWCVYKQNSDYVCKKHGVDDDDDGCNHTTRGGEKVGLVNRASEQRQPLDVYRVYPYSSPDLCHSRIKAPASEGSCHDDRNSILQA